MYLASLRELAVWSRSTMAIGILVGTPSRKREAKNKIVNTGNTSVINIYIPRDDMRFTSRFATSHILVIIDFIGFI
jgi:hypothetical protein